MPQKFKVLPGKPAIASEQPDTGGGSVPAAGSAIGSIRHVFRMELTRQQTSELKSIWTTFGKNGGMIIMQPVINWGAFNLEKCFLQAAVLAPADASLMNAVIENAKRQNDQA